MNSINALGVDMLGTVEGNGVVAPFSASLAIARLRAGTAGATRTGLEGVMHLDSQLADVDAAFNDLDLSVNGRLSLGAQPSIATPGAWAQARYGYLISYFDNLVENYGVTPSRVDFAIASSNTDKAVSDWAAAAAGTPGVAITTDTRFVIGDAVRLSAVWASPFDMLLTETSGFQLLDGSTVEVPFMRKATTLPMTIGNGYVAVALPLAAGQQFLVVLPDEGRFQEIESALTVDRVAQIAAALTPATIDLSLPRFSVGSSVSFDLGIASLKGVADFSVMDGTKDLYVSATAHHARLAANEAGLQAGSSTLIALEDMHPETWPPSAAGFIFSAGSFNLPAPVILGRPFIFAVRDTVTTTILFLGRVVDPRS